MNFRATRRLSRESSARYTTPIPPTPISDSIRYAPTSVPTIRLSLRPPAGRPVQGPESSVRPITMLCIPRCRIALTDQIPAEFALARGLPSVRARPMLPRPAPSAAFILVCVCALAATPLADDRLSWLDRVNFYRASAGLPPVEEDPGLSGAVAEHARYMVRHDEIKHTQNRRRALATPAGAEAAAASVLAGSSRATESDVWAVDMW